MGSVSEARGVMFQSVTARERSSIFRVKALDIFQDAQLSFCPFVKMTMDKPSRCLSGFTLIEITADFGERQGEEQGLDEVQMVEIRNTS